MKKIIGFLICLLFIGSTLSSIYSSYQFTNVKADYIEKYIECDCKSKKVLNDGGSLINPIIINDTIGLSKKPSITKDLPSYFSWKDNNNMDWTTPAKDQGNCGSCWDFAAIGVLESVINIREGFSSLDPDLSEQYVLSCLPRAGSCEGGNPWLAYKYIIDNSSRGNYCNGVILESCFPYEARDHYTLDCDEKCPDWNDKLIPISDWGYWNPDGSSEDINAIKSQIMEIGPVNTVLLFTYFIHGKNNIEEWGWKHHDEDEYYPFPGEIDSNSFNHVVVLVGWNDDQSIGNGGYWIVKNSFSNEWGYDGFFNIEYGSLNIDSGWIAWVDYNASDYNNWPPSVNAGGIYYASPGEEIIFNASQTIDPEDDIILFSWNFGDETQATGFQPTHSYLEKGIYPISLVVTDSNGNIGHDNTWAFIDETNSAPKTPTLKGSRFGMKDSMYECTFYADDPDGDDVFYYLNWGDTFWTGWWEGWIGPYKSGEKVTINNTWISDGNYVVRVKAQDKYGLKSDWATLPVIVPKSKSYLNQFLFRFIDHQPNFFPILQKLLVL